MRSVFRDWERLLSDVDARPTMKAHAAGEWPVKSVIYHATRYADLFVYALDAHLRGEPPPSEVLARPDIDEHNDEHFRQSEQRSLTDVLQESRYVFDRLIALVELQPESFLTQPQKFEGMVETILVGKNLLHVCDHYRGHLADLRARPEAGFAKV